MSVRWQRRLRSTLGLFVVILAGVVIFAITRSSPRPPTRTPVVPADPNAVTQALGATITNFRGGKQNYQIDADQFKNYEGGLMHMTKVRLNMLDARGDRTFHITSDEGRYSPSDNLVHLKGHVHVESSDGLIADAPRATYNQTTGDLEAPGRVSFTKGRFKGHGTNLKFFRERDVIWLEQDTTFDVRAERGDLAAHAVAGGTGIARREHYVKFERGVDLRRGGQTLKAEAATLQLTDDDKRLKALDAEGHVIMTHGATSTLSSLLRDVRGEKVSMEYAPDGKTLQHAILTGGAAVDLAPGKGAQPERKTIAGELIELTFGPDGNLATLAAREKVRVALVPVGRAAAQAARRTITAGELDATGASGSLRETHFRTQVNFREDPPRVRRGEPPPTPRVVTADKLDLGFKPGADDIDEARFTGSVVLVQNDLRGEADAARYLVSAGAVRMGAGPHIPRLVEPRGAIEGLILTIELAHQNITAEGRVKSLLKYDPAAEISGRRSPALFSRKNEPVNVTADKLVYEREDSLAHYTGTPRMWQGDDALSAASIDVDDRSGNLDAAGGVRTVFMLLENEPASGSGPGTAAPAAPRPAVASAVPSNKGAGEQRRVLTTATADKLHYDDGERKAHYEGNARIVNADGDLTAQRIAVYFAKASDELDHLEAFNTITLIREGRTAAGAHLTYLAADERYTMTGEPVRISEADRETVGKTLTFFRANDRIIVDGKEEIRTKATFGAKAKP